MQRSARVDAPSRSSPHDEGRLVEEMRTLRSQRTSRDLRTARALQVLEQTNSSRVRNAAALALADMKAHCAKETLVSLLAKPDTKGARGSLLYALEQLGEHVPLPILIQIIVDDTYEAREEALAFIITQRIECSTEEFVRSRAQLEATATSSTDAERLQAIRRALDYLGEKHYSGAG